MAKFTTLVGRRKQMTLAVKKIIDEAQVLLEKRRKLESEAISLQRLPLDELISINNTDYTEQQMLEQLALQVEMLKNTEISKSVLLQEFKY